jgi:hypothetical protein
MMGRIDGTGELQEIMTRTMLGNFSVSTDGKYLAYSFPNENTGGRVLAYISLEGDPEPKVLRS